MEMAKNDDSSVEELQVLVNSDWSDSQSEADSNHNRVPKKKMYKLNRVQIHPDNINISRTTANKWKNWLTHQSKLLSILSALFYAFSSFLIIVINKVVLTTYKFPSYHLLGLGQIVASILILTTAKQLNIITYPSFTKSIPRKIFPMPLLYLGNLLSGLGGTQKLSLPMFTVLRRFAIPLTLIAEYLILSKVQPIRIILTVVAMVGGSLIAASHDLAFDIHGYMLVISNDIFTAANGVFMKQKLDNKQLGRYGLLVYNCIFVSIPMLFFCWIKGEFDKLAAFEMLWDPSFLTAFLGSCVMGFVLMYSTILCTAYNSALTTNIVGCLKNILVTYLGMYIGGDYVFSVTNFVGVNISMLGSIVYSYYTFIQTQKK